MVFEKAMGYLRNGEKLTNELIKNDFGAMFFITGRARGRSGKMVGIQFGCEMENNMQIFKHLPIEWVITESWELWK